MKVSEIVDQNPWWAEGTDFVSHDPHLKAAQPIFFRRRPLEMAPGDIYTLRGPRQVGKTTYFKETVKELLRKGVPPRTILYLSVDFFTSRRELRSALDYFSFYKWLVISRRSSPQKSSQLDLEDCNPFFLDVK